MRAILFIVLVFLSLIVHISLLLPFALVKLLPIKIVRRFCSFMVTIIAESWVYRNSFFVDILIKTPIKIEFSSRTQIKRDENYMVICNHQSAIDILVLQYLFNGKLPFFKFFIKQELLWVPLLGLAWWALDYPFVKRYTREQIKKKPHLAGEDIRVVRKMVSTYQDQKVSVLNFVEGSRRTSQKVLAEGKKRIYRHLLRPHSSGLSVVLSHMKQNLTGVLDITILYPQDDLTLIQFLNGKVESVEVYADLIPLEEVPIEEKTEIAHVSKNMHRWLNQRWQIKDQWIDDKKNNLLL